MAKVLLVDDDAMLRKALAKHLEHAGHMVYECPDGQQAWDTLNNNDGIQLLLTDVMMPVMDGFRLVRLIQGHSAYESLRIIMFSGVHKGGGAFDGLPMDRIRFIPKPFTMETLLESVSAELSQV